MDPALQSSTHVYKEECTSLRQGLTFCFNRGQFTDITIVHEDGRKFRCHQLVLSAASRRFRRLLENGLLQNSELHVQGVEGGALEALLMFLYTGEARLAFPSVLALCDAAQRLEVGGLAQACQDHIAAALQPSTACWLLDQAQAFSFQGLVELCLTSIEQWFDLVALSDSFARSSLGVVAAILSHCRPSVSADNLFGAAWIWVMSDFAHFQSLQAVAELVELPSHLTLEQLLQMRPVQPQQRAEYEKLLAPGKPRTCWEQLLLKVWPSLNKTAEEGGGTATHYGQQLHDDNRTAAASDRPAAPERRAPPSWLAHGSSQHDLHNNHAGAHHSTSHRLIFEARSDGLSNPKRRRPGGTPPPPYRAMPGGGAREDDEAGGEQASDITDSELRCLLRDVHQRQRLPGLGGLGGGGGGNDGPLSFHSLGHNINSTSVTSALLPPCRPLVGENFSPLDTGSQVPRRPLVVVESALQSRVQRPGISADPGGTSSIMDDPLFQIWSSTNGASVLPERDRAAISAGAAMPPSTLADVERALRILQAERRQQQLDADEPSELVPRVPPPSWATGGGGGSLITTTKNLGGGGPAVSQAPGVSQALGTMASAASNRILSTISLSAQGGRSQAAGGGGRAPSSHPPPPSPNGKQRLASDHSRLSNGTAVEGHQATNEGLAAQELKVDSPTSKAGESLGNSKPLKRAHCQVENCFAELTGFRELQHMVCDTHIHASSVLRDGIVQRLCRKCSEFHSLDAFDGAKRSCRMRLASERRRKRSLHSASTPGVSQLDSLSSPPRDSPVPLASSLGGAQGTSAREESRGATYPAAAVAAASGGSALPPPPPSAALQWDGPIRHPAPQAPLPAELAAAARPPPTAPFTGLMQAAGAGSQGAGQEVVMGTAAADDTTHKGLPQRETTTQEAEASAAEQLVAGNRLTNGGSDDHTEGKLVVRRGEGGDDKRNVVVPGSNGVGGEAELHWGLHMLADIANQDSLDAHLNADGPVVADRGVPKRSRLRPAE